MTKGFEVTLTGTWSRTSTLPEDITMMRRLSYRLNRHKRNIEPSLPITFSLVAKNAGSDRGFKDREGTFKAVVFIEDQKFAQMAGQRSVSRAKQMLTWFLQDATCRPPTLRFEHAEYERVWDR